MCAVARDVSVHVVAGGAPDRERGPTSDVEVDAVGGDVVAQVGGRALVPAGVIQRDRVEENRAVPDRHTRGSVVCGHNVGKYQSQAHMVFTLFRAQQSRKI